MNQQQCGSQELKRALTVPRFPSQILTSMLGSVWFKADFDSLTCSGSIVTAASMDRNCTKPLLRPVLILEALTYEKVHIPESVGNSRAVIWS